MPSAFTIRSACDADLEALQALIPLSVRTLQSPYYSTAQIEAALGPVFGIDRQLIQDQTYYVAEKAGRTVACGGWSKRLSLFGGDQGRARPEAELDPKQHPARIRAFFVHPECARQGIGRALIVVCEQAIVAQGFRQAELVATLAGEPLYAACGYEVVERFDIPLKAGLGLPAVKMTRKLR
ncbi:MAG TPA: GNAT family N-acetyltransferase [Candidatus Saccharimonadales bacterium]|nr:GNAT family N-acetyltransferase [Candidatus Saccharimonadales bacterium]